MFDKGTERAVLAGLFQYGYKAYVEVSDIVDTQSFSEDSNQILFKCLTNLFERTEVVDIPTLFSIASELGVYEIISTKEELKYIKSLFDFPSKFDNIRQHGEKLAKLQIAREGVKKLNESIEKLRNVSGAEPVGDILSIIEESTLDFTLSLHHSDDYQPEHIGTNIEDYVSFLKENPSDIIGISTGFSRFDSAIGGGLRRRTVNLIGARRKVGKTYCAKEIGVHVADNLGFPVLIIDTEMNKEDQLNRILAGLSSVTVNLIETGRFAQNPSQEQRVDNAVEKIKQIPLYHRNVAGLSFAEILSIIRRWIFKCVGHDENGAAKDCLIVYDYFKLDSEKKLIEQNLKEYQVIGFQIGQLHDFCVHHDIPVLAFTQLNREEGVAMSDRLSWICSSVSYLKSKTDDEMAQDEIEANRKLEIDCTRYGPGLADADYINMALDGSKGQLKEMQTRNELNQSDEEQVQL